MEKILNSEDDTPVDVLPDGSLAVAGVQEEVVGAFITPEEDGYAAFPVSREYMFKHNPRVGGYYVVYSDGYKSYSPAKAFEEGYTLYERAAQAPAQSVEVSAMDLFTRYGGVREVYYAYIERKMADEERRSFEYYNLNYEALRSYVELHGLEAQHVTYRNTSGPEADQPIAGALGEGSGTNPA